MEKVSVLFDRLAGGLRGYVENYYLHKSQSKILPSYKVDYEISKDIINGIEKSTQSENMDDMWYLKISGCTNIDELPDYLKKLIVQYLPRFFKEYPQYKNSEYLKF